MSSLLENMNGPSSAYSERKNWKIVPVLRVGWSVMVPLMELHGSQLKLETSMLCFAPDRLSREFPLLLSWQGGTELEQGYRLALRQQEIGKHVCFCPRLIY